MIPDVSVLVIYRGINAYQHENELECELGTRANVLAEQLNVGIGSFSSLFAFLISL